MTERVNEAAERLFRWAARHIGDDHKNPAAKAIVEDAYELSLHYPTLIESLAERDAEIERLRTRLLSAAGDDLCRLTQDEIKAMSAGAVKIPPKEEFLASCERFHAQVAGEAGVLGNCLTLAQLVAENERLKARIAWLERPGAVRIGEQA